MSSVASGETIARLMAAFRQGDKQAANDLVEIFHPQLRILAARYMSGERQGHSWQPTLLVNELYLQLIKIKALPPAETDTSNERGAFFGLASLLMRQLLIHHSRPLSAKASKVPIDIDHPHPASSAGDSIADIDSILARLEEIRPRLRQIVELKAFEGLTIDEISERLGCSAATVGREWKFTRNLLQQWLPPL
ncbi:MAG TPA: ECF-type sigma factor [Bryobacteraceae bacterium]|jgi:RNA polymerase sigma factor (TIGR02999 family)